MKSYRIVNGEFGGFKVEKRTLFIFWDWIDRTCDTIEEAEIIIQERKERQNKFKKKIIKYL